MGKPLIYLAGPINHNTFDEAVGWRNEFTEKSIEWAETLNPLRHKREHLPSGKLYDSYSHPLTNASGIITRDRFDVGRCDLVFAHFLGAELASCGTPIEFGWADVWRKPVVMVIEAEGNPFDHPMMRQIAGYRVETLEEGLEICWGLLCTDG